ncbi:MAG: DUF2088 domain-containing protein [Candidatus Atribacteria bacterium]|nr:DUF2088 domain-containing protein [Candidatus Atribacteria bacterium]MCD6350314.1 DUF2088 domain-containing protein [Candidatus Atribacteria bacterium]
MDVSRVAVPGIEKMKLPRMAKIRQKIPGNAIDNVSQVVREEIQKLKSRSKIGKGKRIAITAGSRGIDRIAGVIKAIVDEVKHLEGGPFVVPAMGSHGGGNAQAQKEILASYGITEQSIGAPIVSSMEVVKLGETRENIPVYIDKNVFLADGIIVVNRVKVHTDFAGEVESGLMKMMVIGLGKHKGASVIHELGFERFREVIPEVGKEILLKAPILFGIALVENACHRLCEIQAVEPEDFYKVEKELLEEFKREMLQIPFTGIDVLVVDEIGKDVSGSGMDTNVIGRAKSIDKGIKIIIALDLTEKTHGNACGIGLADLTTKKLFDKIDFNTTYTNILTSGVLRGGFLPIVLKNDEYTVKIAMKLAKKDEREIRLVRIKNTLEIAEMEISEKLFHEAVHKPDIKIVGELREMRVDMYGNLLAYPYLA